MPQKTAKKTSLCIRAAVVLDILSPTLLCLYIINTNTANASCVSACPSIFSTSIIFFTVVKRRNIECDKEGNNNITQGVQYRTNGQTHAIPIYYFNRMCAYHIPCRFQSIHSVHRTFPSIYELKCGISIYIFTVIVCKKVYG